MSNRLMQTNSIINAEVFFFFWGGGGKCVLQSGVRCLLRQRYYSSDAPSHCLLEMNSVSPRTHGRLEKIGKTKFFLNLHKGMIGTLLVLNRGLEECLRRY